jgi:two-component system chemotaxis response regulator CheY
MAIPMKYLKINCLVVDDEATMRATISNMLGRLGFKSVITAENGKNALDIVKTAKIDLIIADINMPEMTGIELFKAVKGDNRYDHISFIFVTAEARKDIVARAAEGGAHEYLIKPFVMGALEDKVSQVLEKKFNPSSLETYLKNFKHFLDTRDILNAEHELEKAAGIAQDSPTVIYHYGQLALAKGDTHQAVAHFQEAINKKPLFVKAYNAIGEIYEDLGDIATAIKYYEQAHAISPSNAERLIALSKLYYKTGEANKAETMLKEAHADVRDDVSTSGHLLGELYLSKNENDKALEVLDKAHQMNPSDVSIMQSLAEALRKAGKQQEAVETYAKALKININNAVAFYQMGKTYLEMSNKSKAIECIKKAWELNPFSQEITADLKALAEKDKLDI